MSFSETTRLEILIDDLRVENKHLNENLERLNKNLEALLDREVTSDRGRN